MTGTAGSYDRSPLVVSYIRPLQYTKEISAAGLHNAWQSTDIQLSVPKATTYEISGMLVCYLGVPAGTADIRLAGRFYNVEAAAGFSGTELNLIHRIQPNLLDAATTFGSGVVFSLPKVILPVCTMQLQILWQRAAGTSASPTTARVESTNFGRSSIQIREVLL